MKPCNQLEYAHIPYPTTLTPEGTPEEPYPSVAQAGCGLCCAAMLLELLRGVQLPVEEMVRLSVQVGANQNGTDMKRLGRVVAERYGLEMACTDGTEGVLHCLSTGGAAVLNVGGSTRERVGSFSDQGHYVLAAAYREPYVCVFDPSCRAEKYQVPQRAQRVSVQEDGSLGITPQELEEDLKLRSPSAYLFWPKSL